MGLLKGLDIDGKILGIDVNKNITVDGIPLDLTGTIYNDTVVKTDIANIQAILTSNDVNLDQLQELVDAIKNNQILISALNAIDHSKIESLAPTASSLSRVSTSATDTTSGKAIVEAVGLTGNTTSITLDDVSGTVSSNMLLFPGLVYNADYSNSFTTRSIIDKAYVDNSINLNGGAKNLPLPIDANLNTYASNGFFVLHNTADAANGLNYPIKEAGVLEVSGNSSNTLVLTQKYTTISNSVYTRTFDSATSIWTQWARLITTNDAASGKLYKSPVDPNLTYTLIAALPSATPVYAGFISIKGKIGTDISGKNSADIEVQLTPNGNPTGMDINYYVKSDTTLDTNVGIYASIDGLGATGTPYIYIYVRAFVNGQTKLDISSNITSSFIYSEPTWVASAASLTALPAFSIDSTTQTTDISNKISTVVQSALDLKADKASAHSHANKALLDSLSTNTDGQITHNGQLLNPMNSLLEVSGIANGVEYKKIGELGDSSITNDWGTFQIEGIIGGYGTITNINFRLVLKTRDTLNWNYWNLNAGTWSNSIDIEVWYDTATNVHSVYLVRRSDYSIIDIRYMRCTIPTGGIFLNEPWVPYGQAPGFIEVNMLGMTSL